jgi:hypothetical protein
MKRTYASNGRRRFRGMIATGVVFLILITPTVSLSWGPGGHMMTASIAFERLKPNARAKVLELLAIEIEPVVETVQSKDFINASHWADDLRDYHEFDFLLPFHFINLPFSDDGTTLPTNLPKPNNILKGLEDNVNILKTSPDKKAQARALRLIIHFVGDIHQPLHNVTRISQALHDGDLGGNSFMISIPGQATPGKLHSYWDAGLNTFPPGGPPPGYDPPTLDKIPPAVAIAKQGNPATDPQLKLNQPFNFKLWSDESFALAKDVAYKGITEGGVPSATYKAKGVKVVNRRVAWGGYRLAELLNKIWP